MLEMPNGAIAKSYIPSTGKFVPATQAGKNTLRRAAKDRKKEAAWIKGGKNGTPPSARHLRDSFREEKIKQGHIASRKELSTWGAPVSSSRVKGRTVNMYERPGLGGETMRIGGRRGDAHVRVGTSVSAKERAAVTSHEMAHARATRPEYRTYAMNRRQRGAEEGRADAVSRISDYRTPADRGGNPHGGWYHRAARTPSADPARAAQGAGTFFASGRKWRGGYRDAQDKVYGAQGSTNRTGRVRNQMSTSGKVIYGSAAGGTGYAGTKEYRERRRVSKMSPDPSALHVPGARGKLTRVNRTPKKRTAGMG